MNAERKTWLRRLRRGVLTVILALVAVAVAGVKLASKSGLNREMEEIRKKGLPTNPKELDAWYAAVPAAENAAVKFLEAAESFVEPAEDPDPGEIDWNEIPHDVALDAETIEIVERHSRNNAQTLRLMREAARLERSRYPVDLSQAPDIKFDHLIRLRRLAQLARWDAALRAERGDAAGAVEAIKCGFALGHTLAQEPLLISELVRMACMAIQLSGMERVINMARFDDAQFNELGGQMREALEDSRRSLHRAFIGERAFANSGRKLSYDEYEQLVGVVGVFGVMGTSPVPQALRKPVFYARRVIGMEDTAYAFYLRSLGRMIDAAAMEDPVRFAKAEALSAEIATELSEHPIAYELARVSLSSMLHVPRKEAILTARLRCMETALEIERWRRKNGERLPAEDELASIFKERPRDPVDGTALKFSPNGQGGYRVIAEGASAEEKKSGGNRTSPGIGASVVK